MPILKRAVVISVKLADNPGTAQPSTFASTTTSQVNLVGHRVSVRIRNAGSANAGVADVKIYGIRPSLMAQLSTLGLVFNLIPRNTIIIQAGNYDSNNNPVNLSTVFSGIIMQSYGDYQSQPDVPFVFSCRQGPVLLEGNANPLQIQGGANVADLMQKLATQMGLGFQNFGVTAKAPQNANFRGSAKAQADQLAEATDTVWGYVPNPTTMGIWPRGSSTSQTNQPIATISPGGGGMISYPSFTQQGIIVKTLFNPLITFGSLIAVNSSVLKLIQQAIVSSQGPTTPQGGQTFPTTWAVNKMDLALDSLVPKGEWSQTLYAYNPGFARTIIAPP